MTMMMMASSLYCRKWFVSTPLLLLIVSSLSTTVVFVRGQRGGCLKLWTSSRNGRQLSLINARDGTTSAVGTFNEDIRALAWSGSDMIMYGLQDDDTLVAVNLLDATVRTVGNGNGASGRNNLAGIAVANTSVVYTYQNSGDNAIFRLNTNNGNAIRVFNTEIGNNNIVDVAYSNHRKLLYATDGSNIYSFSVNGTDRVEELGTIRYPSNMSDDDTTSLRLSGITFSRRGKMFGLVRDISSSSSSRAAAIYAIADNLQAQLRSTSTITSVPLGATFECRKEDIPFGATFVPRPTLPPTANQCQRVYTTHRRGQRLSVVDEETGDVFDIGIFNDTEINSLAYSRADRAMYGLLNGRVLAVVNTDDATVVRVSTATNSPRNLAGLAVTPPGRIYTYQNSGRNAVYRFDATDGEFVEAFETNLGNDDIVDLAYSSQLNRLFATDGTNVFSVRLGGGISNRTVVDLGEVQNLPNGVGLAGIMFSRQGRLYGISDAETNAGIYRIGRDGDDDNGNGNGGGNNNNNNLVASLETTTTFPDPPMGGTFLCQRPDTSRAPSTPRTRSPAAAPSRRTRSPSSQRTRSPSARRTPAPTASGDSDSADDTSAPTASITLSPTAAEPTRGFTADPTLLIEDDTEAPTQSIPTISVGGDPTQFTTESPTQSTTGPTTSEDITITFGPTISNLL